MTFAHTGDGARVKKAGLTKTVRYLGSYEEKVTDHIKVKHILAGSPRAATRMTVGANEGWNTGSSWLIRRRARLALRGSVTSPGRALFSSPSWGSGKATLETETRVPGGGAIALRTLPACGRPGSLREKAARRAA